MNLSRPLRVMAWLALLSPGIARAQDASRASEAEALFEQGRKLAAEGKWAEACPKLAASEQADPGAGTLLNLGNCYEQNHQTASAWATFKEAASMAKQQGRADWEALARARSAALEPRLSKIVIAVPKESLAPGLVVKRDGVAVPDGAWGAPLPLDPQAHKIEASAPGKVAWSASVTLPPDGASVTVTVPRLEDAPEGAPSAGAAPSGLGTQRTVALVVGGVGIVGLAIGSVTGVLAINKEKDSRDKCPNDPCTTSDGFQANEDARNLARISTIAFVAGGVAVAAGAVLWLTAPRGAPATGRIRVMPLFEARGAGLGVAGAF